MALNTLESLVLNSNVQVGDRVVNVVRMGSKQGNAQPSAVRSYPRHPSHRFPWADMHLAADERAEVRLAADAPAARAGRPGSWAGVLVSLQPASLAGRAVLSRRPAETEGLTATATRPFGIHTELPAVVGLKPLRCSRPLATKGDVLGRMFWPMALTADSGRTSQATSPASATGTPAVRTRGITAPVSRQATPSAWPTAASSRS